MKFFERIDSYLTDREYKIIYKYNYLDIINYVEVVDFTDKVIKIKYKEGMTRIYGDNLVIAKMLDNELVIVGNIDKIEI